MTSDFVTEYRNQLPGNWSQGDITLAMQALDELLGDEKVDAIWDRFNWFLNMTAPSGGRLVDQALWAFCYIPFKAEHFATIEDNPGLLGLEDADDLYSEVEAIIDSVDSMLVDLERSVEKQLADRAGRAR